MLFHSREGLNAIRWRNADFDVLSEQAAAAMDRKVRLEFYAARPIAFWSTTRPPSRRCGMARSASCCNRTFVCLHAGVDAPVEACSSRASSTGEALAGPVRAGSQRRAEAMNSGRVRHG